MTTSPLRSARTATAVLLVALEFTNLVPFLAEWRFMSAQHSRYPFQYTAYFICILLLLLDRSVAERIFRKPLIYWLFATLALLMWAMVVRTFRATAGFSDYLVFREFGIRLNSLGFLLTCVLIFDEPRILSLVKRVVIGVTLAAVPLILYDALQPGLFSDIPGRGAGLYMQPNSAGMALVFGCLIGLTAIKHKWKRELFVLYVLVGVLSTFSREAMLAFIFLVFTASIAHRVTASRVAIAGGLLVAVAFTVGMNSTISSGEPVLNHDAWARVTLQWSDSSTRDREDLLSKTLEKFEEAPLLGQGFGTTIFWEDDPAHNSYLDWMADCGILGVFVLPGLVWAIRRRAWDFYAFAGIFLLWGFFNHQLLTELYALLTIAIQVDEPPEVRRVCSAVWLPASLLSNEVRIRAGINKPAVLR
jgi:hypothetical protein